MDANGKESGRDEMNRERTQRTQKKEGEKVREKRMRLTGMVGEG
jgi:hypothetical protein